MMPVWQQSGDSEVQVTILLCPPPCREKASAKASCLSLFYIFGVKQVIRNCCCIPYNYPLNPIHSSSFGHLHLLGLNYSGIYQMTPSPQHPLPKTSLSFSQPGLNFLFNFHSTRKFYHL